MTKEIPLTQGKVALVDDDDFEVLNQVKWHVTYHVGYTAYAVHSMGPRSRVKSVYMHRQIMNAPDGVEVDHINGNGLDNRRENLRLATPAENCRNSPKQRRNTSGYKGVTWHKRARRWMAQIGIDGKTICVGYFKNPKDAAKAYDAHARELHGIFARTNF